MAYTLFSHTDIPDQSVSSISRLEVQDSGIKYCFSSLHSLIIRHTSYFTDITLCRLQRQKFTTRQSMICQQHGQVLRTQCGLTMVLAENSTQLNMMQMGTHMFPTSIANISSIKDISSLLHQAAQSRYACTIESAQFFYQEFCSCFQVALIL